MAKKTTVSQPSIQNRRARFDYFIDDTIEAGLMLEGSEVKALRAGRASLTRSFAGPKNGELYLQNCTIEEYTQANQFSHEPRRARKLLVHRRQRDRLMSAVQRDGFTLVPMKIYFNERGIAKLQLGLGRGKKKYDKRQVEKERDWNRQKTRLLREQ
jgi:SsrA-binding protein